jgi:hypothetical protein
MFGVIGLSVIQTEAESKENFQTSELMTIPVGTEMRQVLEKCLWCDEYISKKRRRRRRADKKGEG